MMSDEKRLIRRLLRHYELVGVIGRPVLNQSHTVLVNYGLALVQIIDLDEKNQILTTNVWSRYVSANGRTLLSLAKIRNVQYTRSCISRATGRVHSSFRQG